MWAQPNSATPPVGVSWWHLTATSCSTAVCFVTFTFSAVLCSSYIEQVLSIFWKKTADIVAYKQQPPVFTCLQQLPVFVITKALPQQPSFSLRTLIRSVILRLAKKQFKLEPFFRWICKISALKFEQFNCLANLMLYLPEHQICVVDCCLWFPSLYFIFHILNTVLNIKENLPFSLSAQRWEYLNN